MAAASVDADPGSGSGIASSASSRYRQARHDAQRSAALRGDARTGAHPTAASSGAVWLGPSRYVALPSSSLSASQHGRAAAHRGPDAALLPPPPLPFWHTSRRFWIASGAGTYSVAAEHSPCPARLLHRHSGVVVATRPVYLLPVHAPDRAHPPTACLPSSPLTSCQRALAMLSLSSSLLLSGCCS